MNIRWNSTESRFEAEFSIDFQGDLEAVKTAKFHTTGPPDWIWYAPSPGIKALNRLRAKKPASGLTISPEALAIYQPLAIQEAANEEVKKQLAEAKKKAKKEEVQNAPVTTKHPEYYFTPEWYEAWRDAPIEPSPKSTYVFPFPVAPPPDLKCIYCHAPVYFYEQEDPPICMWCQKQEDEEIEKLFENKT